MLGISYLSTHPSCLDYVAQQIWTKIRFPRKNYTLSSIKITKHVLSASVTVILSLWQSWTFATLVMHVSALAFRYCFVSNVFISFQVWLSMCSILCVRGEFELWKTFRSNEPELPGRSFNLPVPLLLSVSSSDVLSLANLFASSINWRPVGG